MGEEGTDICESVYETDEMAATERRTTVGEVDQASLNEKREILCNNIGKDFLNEVVSRKGCPCILHYCLK